MNCVTCEKAEAAFSLYECEECSKITRRKVILDLIRPRKEEEQEGFTDSAECRFYSGKPRNRSMASWESGIPEQGEL